MKQAFFVICLLGLSYLAIAQSNETTVILSDSAINHDVKLARYIRVISKDWNVRFKDSCLIISLKDSIWVSYYNAANHSTNDTSERLFKDSSYIMNNGKRILPEMTFYLQHKWAKQKIAEVNRLNIENYQQSLKLKKKYHLDHLQEWKKWNESGFLGATPEDEKRIQQYMHDKKILDAQRIQLPTYSSSDFSIFVQNENWQNPLPYMIVNIYPKEKVEAMDQTLEDFFKVHSADEQ